MSSIFRNLHANEIECRVQTVKQTGFSILLYKDARSDMTILDECVGAMNWKRSHLRDNKNCVVSIWCSDKKEWVSKEDTGTESNTEQAKGLASDSFKRACFNWGIGRELYSSPFIWINDSSYIKDSKRKDKYGNTIYTVFEKFNLFHISTEDGIIKQIGINDSKGKCVFKFGSNSGN